MTKITALTALAAGSVDRTNDVIEIADVSATTSKKVSPNALMNISGNAVGDTDIQTLTNKTLTAPNVSNPVYSGTITGTYTLGGTPTFPASVTTLTGAQTLTNKVLTSPTINTPTINNPTLNTNSISEFTATSGVTIDGVLLKDGAIGTNGVVTASITDDATTDAKLIYGKIRSRQGGSSTNWGTAGTTTYDYSATDTFTQVGVIASAASPKTVTFPTAFNQVPIVFAQVTTVVTTSCFVVVTAVTTTTFTMQVYDNAGATNTAQTVNWLAMGQ